MLALVLAAALAAAAVSQASLAVQAAAEVPVVAQLALGGAAELAAGAVPAASRHGGAAHAARRGELARSVLPRGQAEVLRQLVPAAAADARRHLLSHPRATRRAADRVLHFHDYHHPTTTATAAAVDDDADRRSSQKEQAEGPVARFSLKLGLAGTAHGVTGQAPLGAHPAAAAAEAEARRGAGASASDPEEFVFDVRGAQDTRDGRAVVGIDAHERQAVLVSGTGAQEGHVHVLVRDVVAGVVHRIHVADGEQYELVTTDPALLPDEEDPIAQAVSNLRRETEEEEEEAKEAEGSSKKKQCSEDGSYYTVAIFWSAEAEALMGGSLGMTLEMTAAMAEMSTSAYPLSGVQTVAEQCVAQRFPGTFNDNGDASSMMSQMQQSTEVLNILDTQNCDASAVVVQPYSFCGLGSLPGRWTVTSLTCVSDNWSFAHELGHNLGCGHGDTSGSGTASGTNNGYSPNTATQSFRTILAYSGICSPSCPRVGRFSNPSQGTFRGFPIGQTTPYVTDNAGAANLQRIPMSQRECEPGTTASIDRYATCIFPDRMLGTSSADSIFFDVVATTANRIIGVDIPMDSTDTSVNVYYKIGSAAGSENTAGDWTLSQTTFADKPGRSFEYHATADVPIAAGQTIGIAVTVDAGSMRVYQQNDIADAVNNGLTVTRYRYTSGVFSGTVQTGGPSGCVFSGSGSIVLPPPAPPASPVPPPPPPPPPAPGIQVIPSCSLFDGGNGVADQGGVAFTVLPLADAQVSGLEISARGVGSVTVYQRNGRHDSTNVMSSAGWTTVHTGTIPNGGRVPVVFAAPITLSAQQEYGFVVHVTGGLDYTNGNQEFTDDAFIINRNGDGLGMPGEFPVTNANNIFPGRMFNGCVLRTLETTAAAPASVVASLSATCAAGVAAVALA